MSLSHRKHKVELLNPAMGYEEKTFWIHPRVYVTAGGAVTVPDGLHAGVQVKGHPVERVSELSQNRHQFFLVPCLTSSQEWLKSVQNVEKATGYLRRKTRLRRTLEMQKPQKVGSECGG